MAETFDSYHGHHSPDAYWQGEHHFRLLRGALQDWGIVTIGFYLPDIKDDKFNKYHRAKGVVTRVFREREVPFVEVAYAEYDERFDVGLSPDFFESKPPIEDAISAVFFSLEMEEIAKQSGQIPEGVACEGPITFSLADFPLLSLAFEDPKTS